MSHVFGYTQANDVTWTQWVHGAPRWSRRSASRRTPTLSARSGPTSSPPTSSIPVDLAFTVTVNGEVRTDASTQGLAWNIATILEFLSRDMTLWPGDLISTGTCEAKDIVAGDLVTVEFDGLGGLENPVIGGW